MAVSRAGSILPCRAGSEVGKHLLADGRGVPGGDVVADVILGGVGVVGDPADGQPPAWGGPGGGGFVEGLGETAGFGFQGECLVADGGE